MDNWYNEDIRKIEEMLDTDIEHGLDECKVNLLQKKYGLNELKANKTESVFIKFLNQFKDFSIIILIIAAIISAVIGIVQGEGIGDAIVIFIVILVNAVIGVSQEVKAEKSLEALQKLSSHVSKVKRNGAVVVMPSNLLVPGDIVVVETGDYISADLRIIDSFNLKAQESSLTGESLPVEKNANVISGEVGIGDRTNMLFASSFITYGRCDAIVVETGMNTEVGKIANMLNTTTKQETPLQTKLNSLGKTLGALAIIICILIFIIGIIQGKDPMSMFMTAVSLAVAAIPEGLVAVSTIVLAIGVQKMVKKNAIVKKLPAVETLGSASVICSDKTGTLTQNKMTVKKAYLNSKTFKIEDISLNKSTQNLFYNALLCNDTKITNDGLFIGDPTETALTESSINIGVDKSILESYNRFYEIPFDSDRKLMTTVNRVSNSMYVVNTKGGLDEVLNCCISCEVDNKILDIKSKLDEIYSENEKMACDALRVLAFAYKIFDHEPNSDELLHLEENLIFSGMLGMIDPPREEVKEAIKKCKSAGIKTVMITGDHKITAIAIAKQLGILASDDEAITGSELENMSDETLEKNVRKYSVYARVSPEHKVRIVRAWQKNGEIVAMTGDGVNDSPALKTSDIGCAMGVVGTEVAKEAADVILTDDNFATIVSAVEEGRRIYDNILKVIQFLLSSNIGEVIVLFLTTLFTPLIAKMCGVSNPSLIEVLLPIHILWINLVTDSFPALALAFDPANKNIMERKPTKNEKSIFTGGMTYRVVYHGIMIGLITLTSFIIGLVTTTSPIGNLTLDQSKVEVGQTMAFITMAFAELVHVFNVRNNKKTVFSKETFANGKLFINIGISSLLIIVILLVPQFREVFSIPVIPINNIFEIVILSISPIIIVELFKLFKINGRD